ncbi:Fungal-type protein kinase domain-containing protein [Pleurotus pulmonarius]
MVTEPLNDHAPLVRFILSLSFAHVLSTPAPEFSQYTVGEGPSARPTSPSSPISAGASYLYTPINHDFALEAHGYDPTMQQLRESVYRIRVGDTWYITAGTLSDSRAEHICGRCTRVWRVYEDKKYKEGEEKVYYVLKDVWVDSRNNTEAAIWKRLKEKVDPEVFDRHFLTLVAAFQPGEGATTCSFFGRGGFSPTENMDFMDSQFIDTLDLEPSPLIPEKGAKAFIENRFYIKWAPDTEPTAKRAKERPQYHPRTHDRSIWKEVCKTYHDQDDMQVMFTMLQHAVKALDAMWEGAHAIHRDISTGNILLDGANGRLGDLECVVFYDDELSTVHNVKTGTLQFMAVEVSDAAYLFEPIEEDIFLAATPAGDPDAHSIYPFRHNALHDLESIWWLVMWSIFNYYPNNAGVDPQALETQRNHYEALFSPGFGLDMERMNALRSPHPRFISSIAPPFHAMGELALRLRNVLRASYGTAETALPIKSDCQAFRPAFDMTAVLLKDMQASLEKDGIAGVTYIYELL